MPEKQVLMPVAVHFWRLAMAAVNFNKFTMTTASVHVKQMLSDKLHQLLRQKVKSWCLYASGCKDLAFGYGCFQVHNDSGIRPCQADAVRQVASAFMPEGQVLMSHVLVAA